MRAVLPGEQAGLRDHGFCIESATVIAAGIEREMQRRLQRLCRYPAEAIDQVAFSWLHLLAVRDGVEAGLDGVEQGGLLRSRQREQRFLQQDDLQGGR